MGVSAISRKQLIEYVKKAMDMEMGRRYIEEMHLDIQRKIWRLEGNYNEVSRRQHTIPKKPIIPVEPVLEEYRERKKSKFQLIGWCAIILAFIIGATTPLGILLAFPIIFGSIFLIADRAGNKKYDAENKDDVDTRNSERLKAYRYKMDMYPKEVEEYNRKYREYETAIENDKRALQNLKDNIARMETIKKTIVDKLDEAKEQIETFYSVNIIHRKYRGLNPMCKFYEYFDSGKCDTLKEAMNTYDNEMFQTELGNKLDNLVGAVNSVRYEIAYLGDTIENNISRISDSFTAVNKNLDAVNGRLDTQAYYAQISSECNKQIANNLNTIRFYEDMKWIDYQKNNY